MMTDPISIGGLVALALTTATEAVVKGAVEEATKDAYSKLRERLSRLSPDDVNALERSPTSVGRQITIAELVDAQPKEEQDSLRILAQTLASAMNKRISADDLLAQAGWQARLYDHQPKLIVIVLTYSGESHRLEVRHHFLAIRTTVDINGNQIASRIDTGDKTVDFRVGIHENKFLLRYKAGISKIEKFELWIDNRPILRAG
jgi:hypothetical protein